MKQFEWLLFLIAVFVSMPLCLYPQADQTVSVSFSVFDHYTSAPVDSAHIAVLYGGELIETSYTDSSGFAQLELTITGMHFDDPVPHTFFLSDNYPNPFREETSIDFSTTEYQSIYAEVYNILGQRVLAEELILAPGYYTLNLSLANLSTGVYFLHIRGQEQQTVKLMKLGRGIFYDGGVSGRPSIRVSERSVFGEILPKSLSDPGEFTVLVEKNRYESWSSELPVESDMHVDIPIERQNEVIIHVLHNEDINFAKVVHLTGITDEEVSFEIVTPDTLILKSGVYHIGGETDTTRVDQTIEIISVDTVLVFDADDFPGVYLDGDPEDPAIDATYDIDIPIVIRDEEISVVEIPEGTGRFLRSELEISLSEDATIGMTNELLLQYNARIVSMLENIPNIVIRIPDPGSMDELQDIVDAIEAEDIIEFVIMSALIDEEPTVFHEDENGNNGSSESQLKRDIFPQIIPENHGNIVLINHHLAARGHAAWNLRDALPPLNERPWLLIADLWGSGSPEVGKYDIDIFDNDDFATENADNHGYHVLGIITGAFEEVPDALPSENNVTGIYPGTLRIRAVDIQSEEANTWPRRLNLLIRRVKDILHEDPEARIIINTSLNSRVYGNNQNNPAISWIRKVRGGFIESFIPGAGYENHFIHFTSAGNTRTITDPPYTLRWEAKNNSMFAYAALGEVAFVVPGVINIEMPNLTNTFVVENRVNTYRDVNQRPLPGCAFDGSIIGGNLSGMGTRVWSFTATRPLYATGTSMATPQAAGIAAYAWSLNPELSVPELKELILTTAEERPTTSLTPGLSCNELMPQPVVDAYAAVLAAGGMNAIEHLLDISENGVFDHTDLELFVEAFDSANGALDYSRFDLNGDGRTGGDSVDRFDLTLDGEYSVVSGIIEDTLVEFDESELTDIEILCYWAYSDLYQGDTTIRHQLIAEQCGADSVLPDAPWTAKADFGGTARFGAVGFSIGEKVYIGTGFDGGFRKDFWEYDPVTNDWSQIADFGGQARAGAVGFSIGNKGYVGLGSDGPVHQLDFWEYDPDTDSWNQIADFPGQGRSYAVAFSIDSTAYVGTGRNINLISPFQDFWEYNPSTDTWTQKNDFPGGARTNAVGFSIDNRGYMGTGSVIPTGMARDFWEYNPDSDTWNQRADFGGPERQWAVGFSIGNKGYIGTGEDLNMTFRSDFWEYDPVMDNWIQRTDLGGLGQAISVGVGAGEIGYIGTGLEHGAENSLKDFWEYDPQNEEVMPEIGQMPE